SLAGPRDVELRHAVGLGPHPVARRQELVRHPRLIAAVVARRDRLLRRRRWLEVLPDLDVRARAELVDRAGERRPLPPPSVRFPKPPDKISREPVDERLHAIDHEAVEIENEHPLAELHRFPAEHPEPPEARRVVDRLAAPHERRHRRRHRLEPRLWYREYLDAPV